MTTLKNTIKDEIQKVIGTYAIEDAVKYGTDAAIILRVIRDKLDENIQKNAYFYEGKVWMAKSVVKFANDIPQMTVDMISRELNKLIADKVIYSTSFPDDFNKIIFYTINEPEYNAEEEIETKEPLSELDLIMIIMNDKKVSSSAKVFYTKLIELCRDTGYCTYTDSEFGRIYNNVKGTVRKWLADLKEGGYINIGYTIDGSGRKRKITITNIDRDQEDDKPNADTTLNMEQSGSLDTEKTDYLHGIVFENSTMTNGAVPFYKGRVNINGYDQIMLAWKRQGKYGEYITVKIKEEEYKTKND